MRSISIKITLAFMLISLVGSALAAFFINQRTSMAFDRFLLAQSKNDLTTALVEHYAETGDWSTISDNFVLFSRQLDDVENITEHENPTAVDKKPRNEPPFTLVDANGHYIAGRVLRNPESINPAEMENAFPLEYDNQIIGWLIEVPTRIPWKPDSLQGEFLKTIERDILIGAIGALVLATILGALFARSLTRPLRKLAHGTQIIAEGELGYQVDIHSQNEIGQLGSSFNKMSLDLAKSNQARKQMTADIAHDLRTPLSIILGYTEALSEEKLSGSQEVFEVLHQEAQHLSYLIDDLRTLSLLDAGEFPLNMHMISPKALLDRIAKTHMTQAQQKNISLEVDTQPDIQYIHIDIERMAQVFGNLVANALRYVPEGGWIKLSASNKGNIVILTIADNGIGITPEDLPHIFKRFYKGDKARQQDGEVGLGLAIAKSFVEAQKGRIIAESEPGKGSTFKIQFPGYKKNK
jgi:signal transduction histidine kinase